MERITKINYYLDIAQAVAMRSSCLRKKYGAIIVKNDVIIATGYNGAPRGRKNCCDLGYCLREKLNIPRGERYELCRAVHGEANAIISASREQMLGGVMYEVCVDPKTNDIIPGVDSCQMCKRFIINAGLEKIIYREAGNGYRCVNVADWLEDDDSLGKIGY